jgi:hypothetical protein
MSLDPALPVELAVLKDVTDRLERAGLDYMLSGSLAMSWYALPRMTRDIDLVVAVEPEAAERLRRAFEPDYYVPDNLAESMRAPGMFNLLHMESVVKVDMIVRKDSVYRRQEFARRIRESFSGIQIWVVSREDLILSKLVWAHESGSAQQLEDVRNLLAGPCDLAYLDRNAVGLGVQPLLETLRG